jgi:hypothetical protein
VLQRPDVDSYIDEQAHLCKARSPGADNARGRVVGPGVTRYARRTLV